MPRLYRFLPMTLLAVLTVGCSGSDPSPSPTRVSPSTGGTSASSSASPDPDSAASQSPTVAPETNVSRTSVCVDPAGVDPFTGPAVTQFGAAAVMDAYCEAAEFLHGRAITTLTDPAHTDPATAHTDLSFVDERLTVRAAQDWNKATTNADSDAINALTYYRLPVGGLGYDYPRTGPTSLDGEVSAARADTSVRADGSTVLALWFTVTNHLALVKTDAPAAEPTHQMPLVRDVALYLTSNPDKTDPNRDWLIDSWTTEWHSEPVRPLSVSR